MLCAKKIGAKKSPPRLQSPRIIMKYKWYFSSIHVPTPGTDKSDDCGIGCQNIRVSVRWWAFFSFLLYGFRFDQSKWRSEALSCRRTMPTHAVCNVHVMGGGGRKASNISPPPPLVLVSKRVAYVQHSALGVCVRVRPSIPEFVQVLATHNQISSSESRLMYRTVPN